MIETGFLEGGFNERGESAIPLRFKIRWKSSSCFIDSAEMP